VWFDAAACEPEPIRFVGHSDAGSLCEPDRRNIGNAE
jgi:hypothetical protein